MINHEQAVPKFEITHLSCNVNSSGSCTHNQDPSATTWWKLAFFTHVQIDKILIWNRIGDGSKIASRIDQTKVIFHLKYKYQS